MSGKRLTWMLFGKHTFWLFWVMAPVLSTATWADRCREDPEFYKYLSGTIGKPDSRDPYIYLAPCDTMIITKGVTVTLLPNTYLAFANPSPDNVIWIRGHLRVEGSASGRVHLSSTLDSVLLGPDEMESPWLGLYVDAGGSLVLRHAVVHGVEKPITTASHRIQIESSFFKSGQKLDVVAEDPFLLPDDGYIENLDLRRFLAGEHGDAVNSAGMRRTSSPGKDSQKNPLPSEPPPKKKSIFKSPWLYTGLIAILGGGTGYYFWQKPGESNTSTLTPEETFQQGKPDLPGSSE